MLMYSLPPTCIMFLSVYLPDVCLRSKCTSGSAPEKSSEKGALHNKWQSRLERIYIM